MSIFSVRHKKDHSPRGSSALEKPRRSIGNPRKLRFESLEDRQLLSVTIFSTNLDTNPGWTTSGEWAFGHPTNKGGIGHPYPDPSDGYSGRNVYGVNLNGDYSTLAGGPYYLTTTAINCSGYKDVSLNFFRWLNTGPSPDTTATIDVSNDGVAWHNIYLNPTSPYTIYSWESVNYDISAYANNQATVYLRWGYQTTSNVYPYSGWNIDDISVSGTPLSPSNTKIWDGGSPQNSLWSTPENWVGDVAPQAGDDLVFPSAADRWESTNNYSSQVHFNSITVSDSRYLLHGSLLSSTSVQVSAGTLIADRIVADALTIGTVPHNAGSEAAPKDSKETFDNVRSSTLVPQTFAATESISAVATDIANAGDSVAKTAIPDNLIGNPAIATQWTIAQGKETLPEKIPAVPTAKQAFSQTVIASTAPLPTETTQRGNDFLVTKTLKEMPLNHTMSVDNSSLSSTIRLSMLAVRLNDSVAERWSISTAETKKQPSFRFIPSQDAHRLAFQSLLGELEDSEFLFHMQFQKRNQISAKAVDDFHMDLAVVID